MDRAALHGLDRTSFLTFSGLSTTVTRAIGPGGDWIAPSAAARWTSSDLRIACARPVYTRGSRFGLGRFTRGTVEGQIPNMAGHRENRNGRFDLVVIGSGFGSLLFIEGFLKRRPSGRILVLESRRHKIAG
jgi:hypothetical protein